MQAPTVLAEAGLLKPRKATDPALVRIEAMGDDLAQYLELAKPHTVILEVSMSSHGRARTAGGAGTLHIYGMAVGFMWAVALRYGPVELVDTNRWTQGRQKAKRTEDVRGWFPSYAKTVAQRDPGGDVADAIGLGRWWLMRNVIKDAVARRDA